jgi:hypothetical protein
MPPPKLIISGISVKPRGRGSHVNMYRFAASSSSFSLIFRAVCFGIIKRLFAKSHITGSSITGAGISAVGSAGGGVSLSAGAAGPITARGVSRGGISIFEEPAAGGSVGSKNVSAGLTVHEDMDIKSVITAKSLAEQAGERGKKLKAFNPLTPDVLP